LIDREKSELGRYNQEKWAAEFPTSYDQKKRKENQRNGFMVYFQRN
jgi:hypothetical protein